MFVAINATGLLVLLGVQGAAILSRQVSVILRAHRVLFPILHGAR